ncbi:MAG TPA: HIT family protein [Rhodocyclaceae bacterium]|nr:HIT family protein [Rhodocyclaceae bacterium]
MQDCELCAGPGGDIVWENAECRVILVEGAEALLYPGFCRVVWHAHVAEMSDLDPAQSARLMHVVLATERAVRATVMPDKINLASLGNVVPHLHWHVIPRWHDDSRYPRPIWADALRDGPARPAPNKVALQARLLAELTHYTSPQSETAQ